MGVTAHEALRTIAIARDQLNNLALGNGERFHRLNNGLVDAKQWIERQMAQMGRLLDPATLRDGIAIQAVLDQAQIEGVIRQVAEGQGTTPARYEVVLVERGTISGTVVQIVGLLSLLPPPPPPPSVPLPAPPEEGWFPAESSSR